jgi:putative heme-binding domain-containing protein
LAERADWNKAGADFDRLVLARLGDADAFVRRAAADALGRHPRAAHVGPLMRLWDETDPLDTHLVHTIRMALRDTLRSPEIFADTIDELAGSPARVVDICLGIPATHAADFVMQALVEGEVEPGALAASLHHAARHARESRLEDLFALCRAQVESGNWGTRDVVLSLHHGLSERGASPPADLKTWMIESAQRLLAADEPALVQGGIEVARELRSADLAPALAILARREAIPELRPRALDACAVCDSQTATAAARDILVSAAEPLALRQRAAAVLGTVGGEEAEMILQSQLVVASESLAIHVAAALALRPGGAEILLAEIASGRVSALVLQDPLVLGRLRASRVDDLETRLAELTSSLPPADERLRALVETRREGYLRAMPSAEAGAAVFGKICAACHRLDGQGTKIGPDLDGIGLRGLDRLLEDVLDPSRNVDQALRTTVINTVDGRAVSGLLLREEGAVLILADAEGKEVRIPEDDIDSREVSNVSPMPANVAELITEDDFYRLMAYLISQSRLPDTQPPSRSD